MKNFFKNKKAFSIIEVIVSMTILSLLIAGLSSSLSILLDVNMDNSLRVQMNNNLDLLIGQLQKDIGAAEYILPCDSDNSITTLTEQNLNCLRFVYSGKQFTWMYDPANLRIVKNVSAGTTALAFQNPVEKDSSSSEMNVLTAQPFQLKIYKVIDPIDNKTYNDVSIILNVVAESKFKKSDLLTPRVSGVFRQIIIGTKQVGN